MKKLENFLSLVILYLVVFWVRRVSAKEKGCQCGPKEFYDPSAVIESPNYPEDYSNDCNCVYSIFTNLFINVQFESFSIEGSDDCQYDYISFIFDASSRPPPSPKSYCGDGLEKIEGGSLRGKGPVLIRFVSDQSDSLAGFRFSYEFEINGPDPCLSAPCQNNASCSTFPNYYVCECPDGFAGINCEIDKDECNSYPCKNQGDCIDSINSFSCECVKGYSGEYCEIKPELCSSEPCQNGGLCVDRGLDFVCSCPRDFMGIFCENPIPTPAPKTTTTTTTEVKTKSTTPFKNEVDDERNGPEINPDDLDTNTNQENVPVGPGLNSTDDLNPGRGNSNEEDGSSWAIFIVLATIVLVLLLLTAVVFYKWKQRNEKKEKIANIKSKKTASGKGKKKRRLSHTTSYKSFMMKAKDQDKLINRLTRTSEDIIMEEVSEDLQGPVIKARPVSIVDLNQPRTVDENSIFYRNKNAPETFKNLPLPMGQSGVENNITNTVALPTVQQEAPFRIAPEEAVNLLNQIKREKDSLMIPHDSALDQYGLTALPKNSFSNSFLPLVTSGDRTSYGSSYHLPNMPIAAQSQNKLDLSQDLTELSPEEAAEVVNYFLQCEPSRRKTIDTQDAMDVIKRVKNRNYLNPQPLQRERSVLVHPQQVADLINAYPSDERNCGSADPSTFDPSESGYRQHFKRDFREYSTIQEESAVDNDELRRPAAMQKCQSKDIGNSPQLKRSRKKEKHFSYESSLDLKEKVRDWLKNTPKQKVKQRHSIDSSAAEQEQNKSHTLITRPLPSNTQQPNLNRSSKNESPENSENPALRTIKQTRMIPKDNKSSIAVTENKAKNLVENLVKPPARSSQNIVGPGLSMSRENAFFDEGF